MGSIILNWVRGREVYAHPENSISYATFMSVLNVQIAHRPPPQVSPVRILVVDDHEHVRKTICELLRRETGFDIVCEAANGIEAVLAAEKLQPDIVVLDITMPTLGGFEAAVRIRWSAAKTRIVFLSQHNSRAMVDTALATGGHGYVTKSHAGTDLVTAIRAALNGDTFVSKL